MVRDAPGVTSSKLEPIDSIDALTLACAPLPMATSAMTEEMPITMPSTVSPERALLAESAV